MIYYCGIPINLSSFQPSLLVRDGGGPLLGPLQPLQVLRGHVVHVVRRVRPGEQDRDHAHRAQGQHAIHQVGSRM